MERHEVVRMQEIINIFNPYYNVCTKCAAQIRHGQRLLQNWLSKEEIIEDVLLKIEPNPEPQLITESNLDIDVDVEEAEKVGCTKCRAKKKTIEVTTTKTTRKPRIKK